MKGMFKSGTREVHISGERDVFLGDRDDFLLHEGLVCVALSVCSC